MIKTYKYFPKTIKDEIKNFLRQADVNENQVMKLYYELHRNKSLADGFINSKEMTINDSQNAITIQVLYRFDVRAA